MATHELTFPISDPAEILKLHAGDEVIVQGHVLSLIHISEPTRH